MEGRSHCYKTFFPPTHRLRVGRGNLISFGLVMTMVIIKMIMMMAIRVMLLMMLTKQILSRHIPTISTLPPYDKICKDNWLNIASEKI